MLGKARLQDRPATSPYTPSAHTSTRLGRALWADVPKAGRQPYPSHPLWDQGTPPTPLGNTPFRRHAQKPLGSPEESRGAGKRFPVARLVPPGKGLQGAALGPGSCRTGHIPQHRARREAWMAPRASACQPRAAAIWGNGQHTNLSPSCSLNKS